MFRRPSTDPSSLVPDSGAPAGEDDGHELSVDDLDEIVGGLERPYGEDESAENDVNLGS